MSNFNAQQGDNSLNNQIAEVIRRLEALEEKRRAFDDELNAHANQRVQYQLLGTICTSLDRLAEMGASDLFWGGESAPEKQLQRVRENVAEFERKIGAIDGARNAVQTEIDQEEVTLQLLNEELAEQEREAERKAQEFAIEREGVELPYRSYLMPWTKQGEDEKRYRKIMFAVLSVVFVFGGIFTLLKKPPEAKQEVVLDEKVAALVVKKKEPPKPPEKKPEQPQPPSDAKTAANATPAEVNQAHAAVQNKGLLKEGGTFSDILGGADDSNLGSNARVSNAGKVASNDGGTHRSVIGSTAAGGSGGINTAGISSQGTGGGGGGKSITGGGVAVARVESSTAAGVARDKRPGGGGNAARSDEDIQIVFDRYKGQLYRMYQRELRNDPTLQGKLTVRLTIEPDGHVSACTVLSTTLASPGLVKDIVARILSFNFGAKSGIPAVTLRYGPIDFLPSS